MIPTERIAQDKKSLEAAIKNLILEFEQKYDQPECTIRVQGVKLVEENYRVIGASIECNIYQLEPQ